MCMQVKGASVPAILEYMCLHCSTLHNLGASVMLVFVFFPNCRESLRYLQFQLYCLIFSETGCEKPQFMFIKAISPGSNSFVIYIQLGKKNIKTILSTETWPNAVAQILEITSGNNSS